MESTRRRVPRPVQSHPVHVSDPGSPGVPGSTAPQHLMRQCLGRNLRPSPNLFHNKRMNGIDQSSLPSRNTRSSARAMKIPLHAPHMAGSGRWFVGRSIVPAKSDGTTRDGPVLCPSSRLSCCPLTVGHLQHGRLVERQPRRCLHPTPKANPLPHPGCSLQEDPRASHIRPSPGSWDPESGQGPRCCSIGDPQKKDCMQEGLYVSGLEDSSRRHDDSLGDLPQPPAPTLPFALSY
jgi:hypothetical protein